MSALPHQLSKGSYGGNAVAAPNPKIHKARKLPPFLADGSLDKLRQVQFDAQPPLPQGLSFHVYTPLTSIQRPIISFAVKDM
jgi:hypothetical protein